MPHCRQELKHQADLSDGILNASKRTKCVKAFGLC